MKDAYIKWLSELDKKSGQLVGGKGANLAEMFNSKFPVPPAFIITTEGYRHLIEKGGIKEKLESILDSINVDDTRELTEKAKQIRELIVNVQIPEYLKEEIIEAYENLSFDKKTFETATKNALAILKNSHDPSFVAVRSSATTEDLEGASFAGQQESYLNVKGNTDLLETVKKVFASLFTARAIYYRKKKGFSKEKFALAVVVQKMIDSEKSGVIFSSNPINEEDNVVIEAVFGLGEGIVSGQIKPDNYEVSRNLEILHKKIADKKIAITRNSQGDNQTIKLSEEKSKQQVLNEGQIKDLANIALKIEEHYKLPQDIEFAIEQSEIYIVQSRPITTTAKKQEKKVSGKVLLEGLGASPGVGSGKVKIIKDLSQLSKIKEGDILVTEMTNPDMVVSMQKAAGIITDEGGLTSHAAIVSREMGIPAVVGTEKATSSLIDGQEVTVDGFNGKIYEGKGESKQVEILPIVETKTKIKVIVDIPGSEERAAKTNSDSVGLLRLEGIIASGKKHPLQFEKENNLVEYTKILENGISQISKPFKEIWIRTSDIRTDEYASLEGAPKEPEGNPMLGNHGIRFSLKHPEILKAELIAIKNCAEKYPDKKFGVMTPQIISTDEIIKTKKIANDLGMIGKVKIGIMVETPASVSIIKDLLKIGIDFVSFGTNDLTQFTLAIDRNNEEVQEIFDESHPAILNSLKRVIRTCNEMGVESSICGQAGSKPEMAKYLVENGITSISTNADAAHNISKIVAEIEKKLEEEIKNQEQNPNMNKQKKWKERKLRNKFNKNQPNSNINETKKEEKNQIEKTVEKIEEIKKEIVKDEKPNIKDINPAKSNNEEENGEKNKQENKKINELFQKPKIPDYVADTYAIDNLFSIPLKHKHELDDYEHFENNFQQEQLEPKNNDNNSTRNKVLDIF